MYFANAQTLIVIVLILVITVFVIGLLWAYNNYAISQDPSSQFASDIISIRDIMINDSHLHRLLMIEIINDKPIYHSQSPNLPNRDSRILFSSTKEYNGGSTINTPLSDLNSSESHNREAKLHTHGSEVVTFNKMSGGMSLFGKSLIRSFGVAISQRIATLMHKRNEILREYYWSLRNVICDYGNCIQVKSTEFDPDEFNDSKDITDIKSDGPNSSEFNDNAIQGFNFGRSQAAGTVDITVITQRKLEAITREITDNIAASFHIRDVDQTSNKNRPIVHFQRLFNLITMYDKELVNQAKSYASHHYDISMNCAQSASEITHHISDELTVLMKETQQKPKTLP